MERADELLNFRQCDLLRRKLRFEKLLDCFQAATPVEQFEDEVLLFFEAEVIQAQRLFDDPACQALIALFARLQIRTFPQRNPAGGTGLQTISRGGHRSLFYTSSCPGGDLKTASNSLLGCRLFRGEVDGHVDVQAGPQHPLFILQAVSYFGPD